VTERASQDGAAACRAFDGASLLGEFDALAQCQPDLVAVDDGDGSTSYLELQTWSRRLAGTIGRRLGDDRRPVAILLGHRPAAIAALLAVVRAGRTVTLLDPSTPVPRLRQMQALAGAALCVTDSQYDVIARQLEFPAGLIDVSSFDPADDLADQGSADPYCLLFTSGSTGEPKGIRWQERTLLKDASAGQLEFGFTSDDRIALVLPFSFAAGLSVVAWGLTSGASLRLFDPRSRTVEEFADWLDRSACTTLHTTPTLLRALLRSVGPARRFDHLRAVSTCGEPVRSSDVEALAQHVGACAFVNWTGSSEVGVLAMHHVDPHAAMEPGVVPAGRVVDGMRVQIAALDGGEVSQEETPTVGELVVISDNVGAGYCGDAGELASRFSISPSGVRTYRTGDLAALVDGTLHLRGRVDAALKIRGYLVEPAEIETALLATGWVAEAHVAPRSAGSEVRLVAYVVPVPGLLLSVGELRAEMRRRLPLYMIPASVIEVTELPRTERGKVDSRRLAEIDVPVRPTPAAPRTEWETVIAEIWGQVLGLSEIGVDDDFFELGGDSLAVEEVLARLAEYGPDLPTAVLIESPTVRALAAMVGSNQRPSPVTSIVQIRAGDASPALFCFAGAGGVAMVFEFLARSLDVPRAMYGIQMRGLEERGVPEFSVEHAARRFLRALPRFQPVGPYVLCGYSYGGLVAFEVARRLRAAGHEVQLLALIDSYLPSSQTDRPPSMSDRATRAAEELRILVPEIGGSRPRRLWQMLTAGPIRHRGVGKFDVFYRRGYFMSRRYRAARYDGTAVVYTASTNLTGLDHLGWRDILVGSCDFVPVNGDHHTMMRLPNVEVIADDLRRRLMAGT
jgi:acyl-coenzyme A synthetase/AMP-(fatty) acid ligase/thioesterase domain-containing protein